MPMRKPTKKQDSHKVVNPYRRFEQIMFYGTIALVVFVIGRAIGIW